MSGIFGLFLQLLICFLIHVIIALWPIKMEEHKRGRGLCIFSALKNEQA